MIKNKSEKDILVASFYGLVARLERANNLFRNQPSYFRNLFKKYNSSKNDNEKAILLQKIIYELTKLKPKFRTDCDSEITDLLGGFNDDEARVLVSRYLNGEHGIIDNIITVIKAIDSGEYQEKDIRYSEKIEILPFETTENKDSDQSVEFLDIEENTHQTDEEVKPKEIIPVNIKMEENKETTKINISDDESEKKEIKLSSFNPENSKIINLIFNLKIALKERECVDSKTNTEELIELIYYHCIISTNNKENKDILEIFEKNNPINILEKYIEKYGEIVSYAEIINCVNKKLSKKLNELFEQKTSNKKFISELAENDYAHKVISFTRYMSTKEIVKLYREISIRNNKYDKDVKAEVQRIFADAIRNNKNYEFVIKIPESKDNIKAERMIICAQYFNQLPVGMQSKKDMQDAIIDSKLSHPILAEIMLAIIKNLPENLEII